MGMVIFMCTNTVINVRDFIFTKRGMNTAVSPIYSVFFCFAFICLGWFVGLDWPVYLAIFQSSDDPGASDTVKWISGLAFTEQHLSGSNLPVPGIVAGRFVSPDLAACW